MFIWILSVIYFNDPRNVFLKAYTTEAKCATVMSQIKPGISSNQCMRIKVNDTLNLR